MERVEISIIVLTYNHEKYVRKTLESIFSQRINVSYEVLIVDDASTDNTVDVLKEYRTKYPQRVQLFLKKRNDCFPTKNEYFVMRRTKGRYVAVIEGDDYWLDENKLQRQYDFLENNEKFSAVTSDVRIVDENDNEITGREAYKRKENQIFTLQDADNLELAGRAITLLARNYFRDDLRMKIIYKADKIISDNTYELICLSHGDIYQFKDKTSAYRYVAKVGESNFNSIIQNDIYRPLNILRYAICMENFMKEYKDSSYELKVIRKLIMGNATKYSWKALKSVLCQAKNPDYLLMGAYYHFCVRDSRIYNVNSKVKKIGSSQSFKKEKLPFILFGAGGVAEKYLNNYGWKRNVLFLVDNDMKKQNTSYKGYLIKHPDEIKKYKDEAAILILNEKYEEQIEAQLIGMGIENYYCYCSMKAKEYKYRIVKCLCREKWL